MPILTRYTSFETLKAAEQPARELTAEDKKLLAEFEQFLKMLQQHVANTKISVNNNNGKHPG